MENTENQPTFRDAQIAFKEAIEKGILSNRPEHPRYAGNFMYMGTWNGVDKFKNRETRKYIT